MYLENIIAKILDQNGVYGEDQKNDKIKKQKIGATIIFPEGLEDALFKQNCPNSN